MATVADETCEVIITYDISSKDRKFYNTFHDELSKEHGFTMINESLYRFKNKLTQAQRDKISNDIQKLFEALKTENKDTTSIDLIIAKPGNTFLVRQVIPKPLKKP